MRNRSSKNAMIENYRFPRSQSGRILLATELVVDFLPNQRLRDEHVQDISIRLPICLTRQALDDSVTESSF